MGKKMRLNKVDYKGRATYGAETDRVGVRVWFDVTCKDWKGQRMSFRKVQKLVAAIVKAGMAADLTIIESQGLDNSLVTVRYAIGDTEY